MPLRGRMPFPPSFDRDQADPPQQREAHAHDCPCDQCVVERSLDAGVARGERSRVLRAVKDERMAAENSRPLSHAISNVVPIGRTHFNNSGRPGTTDPEAA